ncbi:MAG: ATPase [Firmicutes bacterium]|nr:ATPase [Candidatus Fermentithermobacillaceae bacterium]
MDVLALLDKLDSYLSECPRVPLVGKLLVDEEEVFGLIDDIRAALPQEVEQARWLLKERERILADARKEAEEIIRNAQGQIATMASESVIVREAKVQADELLQRAREVARQITLGSRQYADELMLKVERVLTEVLEAVREGRRQLEVSSPPATESPSDEDAPGDGDGGFRSSGPGE